MFAAASLLAARALQPPPSPSPPPPLLVLPLPTSMTSSPGCLLLSPTFDIVSSGGGGGDGDALLAGAMARAAAIVRSVGSRGESVAAPCAGGGAGTLTSLVVTVAAARAAPYPALGDNETYALELDSQGATLRAPTVWGAMRGLETMSQLVSADAAGAAARVLFVPAARVAVADAPRFAHRGLMVDTGRAFLPLPALLALLDAMAYSKLNVLHWHLSDDQAFPLASALYPRLAGAGAMQAPATSHVYQAADVRAVVAAAQARGIRVVPELDVPGHATSWFAGYPALETDCTLPAGSAFSKPMDPTLDYTYDFLAALFGEVQGAFPDAFFHIGGDEVEMACWQNSSNVAAFMAAHGIDTFAQMQLYFEARVVAQLNATRRAVIWEGNSGAQNAYPPGAIVQVWKEKAGNATVLDQLAKNGFSLIYSTPDWYTDWTYDGSALGYDTHVNGPSEWMFYHSVDPFAGSTLTPAQRKLVLGGEVCAWSPYTDATNIVATVFPRAAAVAERLWSAPGPAVDEPSALADRMRAHRCRLVARGIAAAPMEMAGSCPNAFVQEYLPPYA